MNKPEDAVPPKQAKAAVLLADGKTGRQVAEEIGVTPQTISIWRQKASFEALVNTLRRDALEAARAELQFTANEAVATLRELMRSDKSEHVRLKACVAVLDRVGLSAGDSSLWEWGIGPSSEEEIRQQRILGKAFSLGL